SSTASTSMVALSVSISAMTSPGFTSWPSATSHLASLPSSMVGDSAGIRISVGISSVFFLVGWAKRSADPTPATALASVGSSLALDPTYDPSCRHQHVCVELAHVRLRVGLRELGGAVDDAAHVRVDCLQLALGVGPAVQQAAPHLLDGVVLLAHLLDLV